MVLENCCLEFIHILIQHLKFDWILFVFLFIHFHLYLCLRQRQRPLFCSCASSDLSIKRYVRLFSVILLYSRETFDFSLATGNYTAYAFKKKSISFVIFAQFTGISHFHITFIKKTPPSFLCAGNLQLNIVSYFRAFICVMWVLSFHFVYVSMHSSAKKCR